MSYIASQLIDSSNSLTVERSLSDAISFASAWGAASVDLSAVYGRALIHSTTLSCNEIEEAVSIMQENSVGAGGGTAAPEKDKEEVVSEHKKKETSSRNSSQSRIDENRLRMKAIHSVLGLIPTPKLINVIEDVCSYIFGTLHDIFLESNEGYMPNDENVSKER